MKKLLVKIIVKGCSYLLLFDSEAFGGSWGCTLL